MTKACFCQINKEHIAKKLNKGHNERDPNKITQVIAKTDTHTDRHEENIPLHNNIIVYQK